jgi:hypothetical protein
MECKCAQLREIIDVEDAPAGFVKSLEEVAVGDWVRLMKCHHCKQYWRVDEWDKYQAQFAIKLKSDEGWETLDVVPLQKNFLLQSRGGTTEQECKWANCTNNRVKGAAYCVDHLYETGVRK